MKIEGIGTLCHLNNLQIQRLNHIRGPNRFIAPMAFQLGMALPQVKRLPAEQKQVMIVAYSRLTTPAMSGRGMIRKVRPSISLTHLCAVSVSARKEE